MHWPCVILDKIHLPAIEAAYAASDANGLATMATLGYRYHADLGGWWRWADCVPLYHPYRCRLGRLPSGTYLSPWEDVP